MSTKKFHVATLPRVPPTETVGDEDELASINRLREFRLASLQADPDAFASNYAVESQHPIGFWRARLSSPKATHFVAIASDSDDGDKAPAHMWMGMIVLLGPQDMDPAIEVATNGAPWPMFTKINDPRQDTWDVATYHIAGTFTLPSARGLGVAKTLLKEALRHAAAESMELGKRQVRVGLAVDALNEAAWKLYENVGFFRISEQWYTPLPRDGVAQYDKLAFRYEMRATLD